MTSDAPNILRCVNLWVKNLVKTRPRPERERVRRVESRNSSTINLHSSVNPALESKFRALDDKGKVCFQVTDLAMTTLPPSSNDERSGGSELTRINFFFHSIGREERQIKCRKRQRQTQAGRWWQSEMGLCRLSDWVGFRSLTVKVLRFHHAWNFP